MTKVADLTLIVPVYNRAGGIAHVIADVAAQRVLPARLIIVDDGSTDNTLTVVEDARRRAESRLRIDLVTGAHRGACAARNAGLRDVRTTWTMFFDSDDRMSPDHIATAMSRAADDVDLVGWDVQHIGLDGCRRTLPFETEDTEWHNIMHGTLSTQRYMARTELFRRAGGWDETLRIWVDIELGARLLRVLRRGVAKAHAQSPTVEIIAGKESITGSSWSSRADRYEATLAALRKDLGTQNSDWIDLKEALLAADIAREVKDSVAFKPSAGAKRAVKFAYRYRKAGGRGAARMLRRFFSPSSAPPVFEALTVVVPVYNRADRVTLTLDSIAAQTCRPAHVIVVDDGSTDGTADAVGAWIDKNNLAGRFTLIRAPHRGAAASRNCGLAATQTEWTMFFDSDDRMNPGHIALARCGATPDVDIVGWDVMNHRRDGRCQVFSFHRRDRLWNNLMHGTFGTQRYMARTELFRSVGAWNVNVGVWDDIELGTRLLATEPRIRFVKAHRPTVDMYASDNSLTWAPDESVSRYTPALRAMHGSGLYPESWLKLKTALTAADIGRSNPDEGRRMYEGIPDPGTAVKWAYFYRRHGGRATARLLRMFFRNAARK